MTARGSTRQRSPFWLRRLGLLVKGMRVDRDHPDIAGLRALQNDERFVWEILPHAARSFAPCILALPSKLALPTALGYLYCRVLDTHEDLLEEPAERARALAEVSERLSALATGRTPSEVPVYSHACQDARDEVHALLAQELGRL